MPDGRCGLLVGPLIPEAGMLRCREPGNKSPFSSHSACLPCGRLAGNAVTRAQSPGMLQCVSKLFIIADGMLQFGDGAASGLLDGQSWIGSRQRDQQEVGPKHVPLPRL